MVTTEIVTLIGVILSGAISLITCLFTQNKTQALIEYRLNQVEEKMDKHNNLVERVYKIEQRLDDLVSR